MDHAHDAVPHDGAPDGHRDGPVRDGSASAPAAGPALVAPLNTVGARLRAAREELGMTTADIATRTRITLRHVQALDDGNLSALPGRPYVLGFVRSYARVVGLDGASMAEMARAEMDAGAPRPAPRMVHQFDVDDPAKTPSRLVTWVAAGLFAVVVVCGVVFWRSYYAPDAALPALVGPDAAPQAAPVRPVAHAPVPTAANGPVVFTAREDGLWVKFYDGHGQQLLQKQLARGEAYTVPADAFEPKLWTGRPDALTITIGGQQVPPLSNHRGILRDVPVTAQALSARAAVATPSPSPTPAAAAPVAAHTPRHRPRPVGQDAAAGPVAPATTAPPPPAAPSVAATPTGTVP